ncbi:hypothetical protein P9597_28455 [Aneurinibacillus migulanus]|uniref:hypothetical protein n=1 Tax=Aneurinibacillus migulanus TaxID=47500 RepID=UPI002E23FCBF|nr:hypothetical protein [Aneurinibacillus migulanus]
MKWKFINVLLLTLGVYVLYNAYNVLAGFFTGVRGTMVIYRLGFEIPLNGQSLLGYGLFFMILGVLFLLAPMLINRIRMRRGVTEKV